MKYDPPRLQLVEDATAKIQHQEKFDGPMDMYTSGMPLYVTTNAYEADE